MDYCNRCNYKHLWFLIALVAEHDQCVQHLVFIYQVPTEQTHKHTQASYLERQWKTPTSSDKQTSEHKHDRGQMRYTASILKPPPHTQRGDVLHVGPQQVERPLMAASHSLCSILSGPSTSDYLCLPPCPSLCSWLISFNPSVSFLLFLPLSAFSACS